MFLDMAAKRTLLHHGAAADAILMLDHVQSLSATGVQAIEREDLRLWSTYLSCGLEELPSIGQRALATIFTTYRPRAGLGSYSRRWLIPVSFQREMVPDRGTASARVPSTISHPQPHASSQVMQSFPTSSSRRLTAIFVLWHLVYSYKRSILMSIRSRGTGLPFDLWAKADRPNWPRGPHT